LVVLITWLVLAVGLLTGLLISGASLGLVYLLLRII
jgi:hypothetical protein